MSFAWKECPKLPDPEWFLLAVVVFIILFFLIVVVPAQADENKSIAITIAAEAAGEGFEGMYRVANTIANRSELYHKTPFQVVSQKNQYYGFTAKNRIKLYESVKEEADYLAQNILKLKDKTDGALYFRTHKEPRFKWCKVETARYKNHVFYK